MSGRYPFATLDARLVRRDGDVPLEEAPPFSVAPPVRADVTLFVTAWAAGFVFFLIFFS